MQYWGNVSFSPPGLTHALLRHFRGWPFKEKAVMCSATACTSVWVKTMQDSRLARSVCGYSWRLFFQHAILLLRTQSYTLPVHSMQYCWWSMSHMLLWRRVTRQLGTHKKQPNLNIFKIKNPIVAATPVECVVFPMGRESWGSLLIVMVLSFFLD